MQQRNQKSTKIMTTHLRLSSNFMRKSLLLLQNLFSLLLLSSSLLLLTLHIQKSIFSSSSLIFDLDFSFDRKYMFLLCNGILAILVKSSSTHPLPQEFRVSELPLIEETQVLQCESESIDQKIVEKKVSESQSQSGSIQQKMEEKQVSESKYEPVKQTNPDESGVISIVLASSIEDQMEVSGFFHVCNRTENVYDIEKEEEEQEEEEEEEEEGEEEEEEEEDRLAVEELNMRCEEFIRKMKQGIVSESINDRSLVSFCS